MMHAEPTIQPNQAHAAPMKAVAHTSPAFQSDDARWAAVVRRDPAADGHFFYSVRTTGVYCRPSCASRTPRPENVAFHASVEEAEAAGFRACKRCKPGGLSQAELDHYVDEFTRTGFTGGINWYRNMDRNWELTPQLADAKVTVPALFVAGAADPVIMMSPPGTMDGWVTDLRGSVLLDGAGHWVQQERPAEVNAALIDFLRGLTWS